MDIQRATKERELRKKDYINRKRKWKYLRRKKKEGQHRNNPNIERKTRYVERMLSQIERENVKKDDLVRNRNWKQEKGKNENESSLTVLFLSHNELLLGCC